MAPNPWPTIPFFKPFTLDARIPMQQSFLRILSLFAIFGTSLLALSGTGGSRGDGPAPAYSPRIAPASKEGEQALQRIRVPQGVKGTLFAAEPMLANPVSFCFDEKGRCYVAETFRLHHGVTDDRGHTYWLADDLACRTVADRVALYHKHLKDKFAIYETEHDRVRLIEDTTGKGVADKATVFADGFHHAAEGLGAGVLARKGNVYYTCIPDLWLLKDTKGTGKADVKQSLATGFGVHVSFIGHDMHGLRMGPDGRLYFSIGDRGLNVKTKEGRNLFYPDGGAVLRCEPDGSNLEIVHTGLRNPQELAFDQHGNLFTVDNNSDSGDKARLVYVVEGGDSGWRIGYQYGSDMGNRGPFNAEKIWHLPHEGQPAYIVPPLAHITTGPSGLCFNYGATALPERYKDHFFVCDFRGAPAGSSVFSFAVKPKGAAFEVIDGHEAFAGVLATDCEFGPDGGFYVSDWVEGWDLTGKGRIYRFTDPEAAKNPVIADTKKLIAEGFDKRSNEELAKLLEHADLRVRQEAQFALADKGKDALPTFVKVAKESKNLLARLHAIWGIGQFGRHGEDVVAVLRPFLKDADGEVRKQTARVFGWLKEADGADLVPLLKDQQAQVRFQAALSLGERSVRIRNAQATWDAIVELLKDGGDDGYLRHACSRVMAKYPGQSLVSLSKHESVAVRLGAVLALRQRKKAVVAPFLDDPDPRVAVEAARAIHDEMPIGSGIELAERLGKPNAPEFFLWRALNANYRLGQKENAAAVSAFAARATAPEKLRVEALKMLGTWAEPPRRDRVTGLTQNLGKRDPGLAVEALKQSLGGIFTGPDAVRREAAGVAAKLGIKEVGPALFEIAADTKRPAATRIETLRALETLKDSRLEKARELALKDGDPRLRAEGRRLLARANPAAALPLLREALEKGETVERQGAYAVLGGMKDAEADTVLARDLEKLLANKLPADVQLDLLDAAAKRQAADVKEKLAKFEAGRSKSDHLANYREALFGGDAEAGKRIFLQKAEVSCLRCHKIKGEGGDVGPELAGIGAKQTREYLLESIVDPNRQIAKGFETVVLTLKNGKVETGVLKAEDAKEVHLMTAEAKLVVVSKDQIDERRTGKSAMPEDIIKNLSKAELRDLVEFLAGLK
jgi:quinoprotein glucose dehydrogenase